MARPTKAEQEKKRIAELLAEGKGPDGQPIEEANVISETKNPVTEKTTSTVENGGIVISELENEITNSTLGSGVSEENKNPGFNMNTGDAKAPDTDDPNYIKQSGHDRFRDEMIVNESDANKAATGNPSANTNTTGNNTPPPPPPVSKDFEEPVINGSSPSSENPADDKKKDEPMNPGLDDLSPTEKRKQVEMFADAILETYGQLYEAAFTAYCSVKMNKMEILDRDGSIRLSMVIERGEGGDLTIREQFVKYNEKVASTFVVSPEMKAELREPLIAVLMEKGIAPTPMVSLLIGVGRHALIGIFSAAQLKAEIKEQTETFKQFRAEEVQREINDHKNKQNNPNQNGAPTMRAEPREPKSEGTIVSMEDVMKTEVKPVEIKSQSQDNNVTIEEVVNPE